MARHPTLPSNLFDTARSSAPKPASPPRGNKRQADYNIEGAQTYASMQEEAPFRRMREAPIPETDPIRILDMTRAATVRLMQQNRETQRSYNFILTLQPEATILRRTLTDAMQAWRTANPATGPHPHGPMARTVWYYLVCSMQQVIDSMDQLVVESTIKSFLDVLKDTFYPDTRKVVPAPSPIRTFRGLYKIGIVPAPDREVRYLFNFDHSCKDGRDSHEELLRFLSNTSRGEIVSKLLHIKLDLDKGIPDNLERSLRIADLTTARSLNYEGGH